jgi:hypothetical protein
LSRQAHDDHIKLTNVVRPFDRGNPPAFSLQHTQFGKSRPAIDHFLFWQYDVEVCFTNLVRCPLLNFFFRLDRLLLLLDTGSSTSVRITAAKQLAQLAVKSVISDVAIEEDIKSSRQHPSLSDPSAWTELMAVVARVK